MSALVLHFYVLRLVLKDSRHFLNQSKVEVNRGSIVTRSQSFSRALRRLHVFSSSLDRFNRLSESSEIGKDRAEKRLRMSLIRAENRET